MLVVCLVGMLLHCDFVDCVGLTSDSLKHDSVKSERVCRVTMAGCFIMNFLVVGGAAKSFGILYVEFVDRYRTSSSGTLAIVALSQSLCMLLGQSHVRTYHIANYRYCT